jgi:cytochrome c oxidase subunit 3
VSFLGELADKPWLTQGSLDGIPDAVESDLPTPQFGLRVFLGVVTVLFALFAVVYSERMLFSDWRTLPEPWLLWLNTGILILSSMAIQRAVNSARLGRMDGVRTGLVAAGILTLAFLAGQFWVWLQLVGLGYYAATNVANAFFYLLTALHGVHLSGGLVALGRTALKMQRGVEVGKLRMSLELCATYWHFLLVIWLALFVLLLNT